jgi:polysaccharide biosynthesis transport protein
MYDLIPMLRFHWKALALLNSAIFALALANALLSPKVWEANTKLVLPDSSNGLNASLGTLGNLEQKGAQFTNELSPLKVQSSILTSQAVMQKTFDVDPEKSRFSQLDTFIKLFKVKPEDQSTIIQINVKGSSETIAKQRAENLLSFYQLRLNELRIGADSNRQRFISKQLESATLNLQQARFNLAKFQKQTGLVNSVEQTKSLVSTIDTLTGSHAQAIAQYKSLTAEVNSLINQTKMTPEQAKSTLRLNENKEYQEIRQKLSTVETELAAARGSYTESAPQVTLLVSERNELNSALRQKLLDVAPDAPKLAQNFGGSTSSGNANNQSALIVQLLEAETKTSGARQQVDQLNQYLNLLKNRLKNYSTFQARLDDLKQKQEIVDGVYKGIVAQIQQDKISAFNYYPNVQILDLPTVDSRPVSPKRSFIVFGAIVASIFLSLALVIFLHSNDPHLKRKDLEDIEYPILARIPQMLSLSPEFEMDAETQVEFQRLASTISLIPFENHRLMVSSSIAGEGKTSIVLGLALALTDLGFNVLLVDGDYQRSSLSHRLGVPPIKDRIGPIPVRPRLDLLPPNISETGAKVMEIVAQGSFEQTLVNYEGTGRYDYVLVDSAPVGMNSEAVLMAATVQQVLFVARMGVSKREQVQESLEQLKRCKAQILGLALNGLDTRHEAYLYTSKEKEAQTPL